MVTGRVLRTSYIPFAFAPSGMHMGTTAAESIEGRPEVPPRELKFKVPAEYQRKLYGLKIVTGKNLSQLVTEAVGDYLLELEETTEFDATTLIAAVEAATGQTI